VTTSAHGDNQRLEQDPLTQLPVDFTAFFTSRQHTYLKWAQQLLRNRHDAEDAVQNAGIILYRKWDLALSHANYEAFAFKIVRDAVYDLRRARHRIARINTAAANNARINAGSDQLHRQKDYDLLDRAMETLSRTDPLQADCLRLQSTGQTGEGIATMLGITPGSARVLLTRGRHTVQQLLTSYRADERSEDRT